MLSVKECTWIFLYDFHYAIDRNWVDLRGEINHKKNNSKSLIKHFIRIIAHSGLQFTHPWRHWGMRYRCEIRFDFYYGRLQGMRKLSLLWFRAHVWQLSCNFSDFTRITTQWRDCWWSDTRCWDCHSQKKRRYWVPPDHPWSWTGILTYHAYKPGRLSHNVTNFWYIHVAHSSGFVICSNDDKLNTTNINTVILNSDLE